MTFSIQHDILYILYLYFFFFLESVDWTTYTPALVYVLAVLLRAAAGDDHWGSLIYIYIYTVYSVTGLASS